MSPLLSKATHLSLFLSKHTLLSTFLSTQKSKFALESTFLSVFTLLSTFLSAQKSTQGPTQPTSMFYINLTEAPDRTSLGRTLIDETCLYGDSPDIAMEPIPMKATFRWNLSRWRQSTRADSSPAVLKPASHQAQAGLAVKQIHHRHHRFPLAATI